MPSRDRCGFWVTDQPYGPYGLGRSCRNRYQERYGRCEPCFRRKALAWINEDRRGHALATYLLNHNLFVPARPFKRVMGERVELDEEY